jgi:hypothetical protein
MFIQNNLKVTLSIKTFSFFKITYVFLKRIEVLFVGAQNGFQNDTFLAVQKFSQK